MRGNGQSWKGSLYLNHAKTHAWEAENWYFDIFALKNDLKDIDNQNCCRRIITDLLVWSVLSGFQVGWIFTDLLSEDTRIGTVRYSRNKVRMQLMQRRPVHHANVLLIIVLSLSLLLLGLVLPERRGVHHSGILPESSFKPLQTLSRRPFWLKICDCGGNRYIYVLSEAEVRTENDANGAV